MAELTLDESIEQIFPTLPLPIQKFIRARKVSAMALTLMERYALHVDQGAILERELIHLLLGLQDPNEFATELYAQLPISKQTIKDIMTDINDEVFVPLREEERKTGMGNMPPPIKAAEVVRSAPPPMAVPAPVISTNAPLPPKMIMPRPAPSAGTRGAPYGSQTSINPLKLLEDHEEPHIELTPLPKAMENAAKAQVPPNLPGTNIPVSEVRPSPPLSKVEPPPAPPAQPYPVDPYREPIE